MASPHQKKMVRTEETRPQVVLKKETKMEENQTYQVGNKIQETNHTG